MWMFRMNWISRLLLLSLISATSLLPAEAVDRDTVVASVNGREVTAGELDDVIAGAPPAAQQGLRGNLRDLLQQHGMTLTLVDLATEKGLDQASPYREQLDFTRVLTLGQAAINERSGELTAELEDPSKLEAAMGAWMADVRQQSTPADMNDEYFDTPFLQMNAIDPGTVIATLDGSGFTAGDMRDVLTGAGPEQRERFRTAPRDYLAQYAMLRHLAHLAEQQGLAEKAPYRQQLAWVRNQTLMQATLNNYNDSINVDTGVQREFYEANLDRYTEAEVKVLYISFDPKPGATRSDGSPVLTEEQAKAKIDSLYQQIQDGADFVELVREHSEDRTSRERDGDFGVIRPTSSIPQAIKDIIFSLEEDEVSKPVRQPNGFYLFRVEKTGVRQLIDVLDQIMRDAKVAKFQEWFDGIRGSLDIVYTRPDYFEAN